MKKRPEPNETQGFDREETLEFMDELEDRILHPKYKLDYRVAFLIGFAVATVRRLIPNE